MEHIFIILILISLVMYVFFLFNTQLVNRTCLIKKQALIEKYNKKTYGYFTENNIEIDTLLTNINSDVQGPTTIEHPLRNYTYTINNMEEDIKNYNI